MNMSPLHSTFSGSNCPRGPVVPVTMFMEVSGYPDAATAMQALRDARKDLDSAKARKSLLETERAQRFPDPKDWYWREKWEAINNYDEAGWHLTACYEALAKVEERMGLFHPKHRALLAGWVESAISLLDNLDAPHSEDEPLFAGQSDGLPGSPDDVDTGNGEDEANSYLFAGRAGPGCTVSDPDHVDDDPENEEGVIVPDFGPDQTAGAIGFRYTTI